MQRIKAITGSEYLANENNEESVVTKDALLLTDILRIYEVAAEMRKSRSTIGIAKATMEAVKDFRGNKIPLSKVDKDYCMGFITFLLNACVNKRGTKITKNSVEAYMHTISSSLDMAVRISFISRKPFDLIPPTEKIMR